MKTSPTNKNDKDDLRDKKPKDKVKDKKPKIKKHWDDHNQDYTPEQETALDNAMTNEECWEVIAEVHNTTWEEVEQNKIGGE